MRREEVKKMFDDLVKALGIEEKVKLRFVKMKRKKASVSLKRKEVRLNFDLLSSDRETIREVIIHELLHLKHGILHTIDFEKETEKFKVNSP